MVTGRQMLAHEKTKPRTWGLSIVLTLLFHLGAVLGTLALRPFDADPVPPREPDVIDVVFASPVEAEEPSFFSELPPELADDPPEQPDVLSNVDSRARDDVPGGEEDALPRLEGRSDAPQVQMTPAEPGSEEAEAAAAADVLQDEPPPEETEPADIGAVQLQPPEPSTERDNRDQGENDAAPPSSSDRGLPSGRDDIYQEAMSNRDANVALPGGISLNTIAWDYAPWLQRFRRDVDERWHAPVGHALGLIHGWTLVRLEIAKSGELLSHDVLEEKGHKALRDASVYALTAAAPYMALPEDFPEERLILKIKMIYPEQPRR